jgi:hypothetical protein
MTNPYSRLRVAVFLLLAVALPTASPAQQIAVVERNVNLREDPSTEHPPIRLLKPPTQLTLVSAEEEDGYLEIRTVDGEEGYVWARNVRIESGTLTIAAVASEFDPVWEKPAPNKSQFTGESGKCGFDGTGNEVDSNWRKNRTDIPTEYHDVSFAALASLPYPVAHKNRSKWTDEQLAEIRPYEGVAVRVVGYLVALRPQTGSSEGTNCGFKKAAETDWHMALVGEPGKGEDEAVVVETTPRIRRSHSKWTAARIRPFVDAPIPVRISGWTFLDTEHRNHLERYRSTLWEIHPITKIEVLQDGRWVNVDDLP